MFEFLRTLICSGTLITKIYIYILSPVLADIPFFPHHWLMNSSFLFLFVCVLCANISNLQIGLEDEKYICIQYIATFETQFDLISIKGSSTQLNIGNIVYF